MKKRPTAPRPRRSRSAALQPEFGDWRVPLANPMEAEHLPPKPLSYWHRMHLRAAYLTSAPTGQWIEEAEAADDWQPVRGWKRVVRLLVAYLLLTPLSLVMVYAVLVQLYHAAPTFGQVDFWVSDPVWFSVMGILLFLCLMFARFATSFLVYLYVVGHELTHAITAKMCLGHVETIRFDTTGGYVETDADNFFIALSPYFLPLWMLCWMGVLYLINLVFPFENYAAWFYAGGGFWWGFHLYWTVWIIPREQPDMLENGMMLSTLIVLMMNIAVLLLVLWGFGLMSMEGYCRDFLSCGQEMLQMLRDIGCWAYSQGLVALGYSPS